MLSFAESAELIQNYKFSKKEGITMSQNTQVSSSTREIVIIGISVALIFIATFINIRLPFGQGGLVHLGNVPFFLIAILFGKKIGALSGAFGMALFDLMGGWVLWAPGTFIVVGLMGFAIGWISEKMNRPLGYALALLVACIIKIAGYYVVEGIIYGNWVQPALSIPGNLLQIGVAAAIVLPSISLIKKSMHR